MLKLLSSSQELHFNFAVSFIQKKTQYGSYFPRFVGNLKVIFAKKPIILLYKGVVLQY